MAHNDFSKPAPPAPGSDPARWWRGRTGEIDFGRADWAMGQKPSQADGRMASLADVHAYLSGDRIACLICGKQVRGVGGHVRMVHGITAREYNQLFGLPVTRGLEPQDVRQRRAESVAATRAAAGRALTPPVVEFFGMPKHPL